MSVISETGLERQFAVTSAVNVINHIRRKYISGEMISSEDRDIFLKMVDFISLGGMDLTHSLAHSLRLTGTDQQRAIAYLYREYEEIFQKNNEEVKRIINLIAEDLRGNKIVLDEDKAKVIEFLEAFMLKIDLRWNNKLKEKYTKSGYMGF